MGGGSDSRRKIPCFESLTEPFNRYSDIMYFQYIRSMDLTSAEESHLSGYCR